jgi:outer membrane protein TolC
VISSVAGDTQDGRSWPPRRESGRPLPHTLRGGICGPDDRLKSTNDSLEGTETKDADRCQGDACPTRVAADSEPKRNSERTTAGANAPRLSNWKSCLGLGLVVAQVRAGIPPLEGQRKAALFELATLLGRAPSRAPMEAQACVRPPQLDALIPVGDGVELVRRRPDVRQAERRVAAATARVGVATADLYPRISLTGFFGGVSATLPDLTTNAARAWGVGPSINWSFPNQVGPRARVQQATANASAALAGFDTSVLRALKETEQSLALYGTEIDRRRALADAQVQAQKAFDLAHEQFLAGALTQLELLTTEETLITIDASVAASDATMIQDQISLFKALGGGWRDKR